MARLIDSAIRRQLADAINTGKGQLAMNKAGDKASGEGSGKAAPAAQEAAEKHQVHALVLPAMPFGPTPEHLNFGAGYIDFPQDLPCQPASLVGRFDCRR